uniref:Apolipoprotein L n=1 Tax=Mastacembelus armatus TaxID=205130 RepID=A0A3Q3N251_9TELE
MSRATKAGNELQEALWRYVTDTLICIDTVRDFCDRSSKWILRRETELNMMMDIKDRAEKISHVTKSKNKGKAFLQYMKSKVTPQVTVDSRRAELEKELADVLEDTLKGLEKLNWFLDAVEKLAVTSLFVFVENQLVHLPEEISLNHIQVVIIAAQLVCPRLLEFKRDAKVFFFPRLQNVEVLSYQLDKYIQTTKEICDKLEKISIKSSLKMNNNTMVDLDEDLSEDDIQRMLCHINQLDVIRMDPHFRMVFLFQEVPCSGFISEFSTRQSRMLQFLTDLEQSAVQLDRMNKGAKISSVAGSSVGAVGGVLSIVGLILAPFTAGVSLPLTMTGVGLGLTSGVNNLVTTATEIGVNNTNQNKANKALQSFMEDVQCVQDRLKEVINQPVSKIKAKLDKIIGTIDKINVEFSVKSENRKLWKSIWAYRVVNVEDVNAVHNVPRVAANIPEIGQAVAKGPFALTKSARVGLSYGLNALFLGLDIFFICKDSISLAKGSETEVSRFIRARAALWSSEMESWQRIHDSLSQGLQTSEKNKALIEKPFYS